MAYNATNYSVSVSGLIATANKADDSANAFAPNAFFGLIENKLSIDNITTDLCKAGGFMSKKNKALATALPSAAKMALSKVKRAWVNYGLDNQTGVDVKLAVHGYIGLLSPEQEAELAAILLPLDNATDKRKAKATSEYLLIIYPDRPLSFNALNRAVSAAIAANSEAVIPANAEGEGEGEGEGATANEVNGVTYPNATCADRARLLADALEYIAGMSAIEVDMHNDVLTAMLPAIGNAFATLADWQAANVAQAVNG